MGSKQKKKEPKKSDKKDKKKKSKSSSNLKKKDGKDKKHHDKHHAKKGSADAPKGSHEHKKKTRPPRSVPPPPLPPPKAPPGGAPPQRAVARTPPLPLPPQQPSSGPLDPPKIGEVPWTKQLPQQPKSGPGAPPGSDPPARSSQTGSAEPLGAARSSQSGSAEPVARTGSSEPLQPPGEGSKTPQQQQQQPQSGETPRKKQKKLRPPSQQQPPQQQAQLQPQQQRIPNPPSGSPKKKPSASPDAEKTEKKPEKRGGGAAGKKISKLLDVKFASLLETFQKNAGALPTSVSRAAFDANLCLNRFEDVICIDQTRVLLSDPTLYLHANWVEIAKHRKAIVGQLPLPECAVAFWSMVVENDIKGVLLFADDNEFLTFEAEKTFPMNKSTLHVSPRITVTHSHRVAVSAVWTMNVYLVCRGDVRKYVHVHFYAWAGDATGSITCLWELESVFRRYKNSTHVYMSSAGVGRAATFAALQMLHAKLHDESCKEIVQADCLTSLREQRLHSIQSPTQSITLHSCLIQHILDCPHFAKKEGDPRVRAFAGNYKKYVDESKEE